MQQIAFLKISKRETRFCEYENWMGNIITPTDAGLVLLQTYILGGKLRGERNTDKNVRKFITIRDELKWVQIERLMTLPQYKNTFNQVINNALDYGLPLLLKAEFGEIDTEPAVNFESSIRQKDGEFYGEVIRLLGEIIINVTVNKSILSSLFEARRIELKGNAISAEAFESGCFQDTPAYIEQYELHALRALKD